MFTDYVSAALRQARHEILSDDHSYYGEITGFEGVFANATSLEKCREDLRARSRTGYSSECPANCRCRLLTASNSPSAHRSDACLRAGQTPRGLGSALVPAPLAANHCPGTESTDSTDSADSGFGHD